MAQNKSLLAFRARLKTRGYCNVRIFKAMTPKGERAYDQWGYELWYVTLDEPLLGWKCQFAVSERQMDNWPGIFFDGCGYFSNDEQLEFDNNGGVFC